jgi:uncharacterized LabA/DUF88 family protein
MKTNVYVDGFNLYYGCLKHTPHKWLDIAKLCRLILPRDQINQIKYFTALVSARPGDPDLPMRQLTYLRALATLPEVSIIKGMFLSHPTLLPLAPKHAGKRRNKVWVLRTEEKGSDVNLAAHLLNDGYKGAYELAVIITNDSDLSEPVKMVRSELGLPVGIINPHKHQSVELKRHATFVKQIHLGALKQSQLPQILTDKDGTFHKPKSW